MKNRASENGNSSRNIDFSYCSNAPPNNSQRNNPEDPFLNLNEENTESGVQVCSNSVHAMTEILVNNIMREVTGR